MVMDAWTLDCRYFELLSLVVCDMSAGDMHEKRWNCGFEFVHRDTSTVPASLEREGL